MGEALHHWSLAPLEHRRATPKLVPDPPFPPPRPDGSMDGIVAPRILGVIWPERRHAVALVERVIGGARGRAARVEWWVVHLDPVAGRVLSRRALPAPRSSVTAYTLADRFVLLCGTLDRPFLTVIRPDSLPPRRIELPQGIDSFLGAHVDSDRVFLTISDGAVLDIDTTRLTVVEHPRPDVGPQLAPELRYVPLPPTLTMLDASTLLLTAVATVDGKAGRELFHSGAWLLDTATWAVVPLAAGGTTGGVAGGQPTLTGLARYPVSYRDVVGTGLVIAARDGTVRWRAYGNRPRAVVLGADAGRLYAAADERARAGDVWDPATGARVGRWKRPGGTVRFLVPGELGVVASGGAG
jgi:hypothetical protein